MASTIDDEDQIKCIMEEKKGKSILVQCVADNNLEHQHNKLSMKKEKYF